MRKAFWIALTVFSILLSLFLVFAWLELHSGKDPVQAAKDFERNISRVSFYTPIIGVILLLIANMTYSRHPQMLYFLLVWIFVSFFAMIDWFWFREMFFQWKEEQHLRHGEFSLSRFAGILESALALFIVAINYFLHRYFSHKKSKSIN